jgi:hypothetical protein
LRENPVLPSAEARTDVLVLDDFAMTPPYCSADSSCCRRLVLLAGAWLFSKSLNELITAIGSSVPDN